MTNMTGKYIFVFGTGGTIGWAITQPIAGVLFEIYPFSVVSIFHPGEFRSFLKEEYSTIE